MTEDTIPLTKEDVSKEAYSLYVKVGMQLATDQDYFEICIKKALAQAEEENVRFTTA
jgi:hypothetical protein